MSIDLHVSELGNAGRFRFSLLSADVNVAIQGVVAVDVAPDDFSFWRYSLANRPALRLNGERLFTTAGTAASRKAVRGQPGRHAIRYRAPDHLRLGRLPRSRRAEPRAAKGTVVGAQGDARSSCRRARRGRRCAG